MPTRVIQGATLSALTIFTFTGCSGADASGGTAWTAATDTIGDTVVVRTVAGSVWGDTARLEPELTIGRLEGEDHEIFGDIRSLAVGPDGTIYVLDRQVPVVRKYDGDGLFLGNIGREGGGPGEYKRPESLILLEDGRLLVRDPGNARINVFAPDGSALPSWRLPSGGSFNTSRASYLDTAGNSYTMVLRERGASVFEWKFGLARFTPTGEHTDTIIVPEWKSERQRVSGQSENSVSVTDVPFAPEVEWTFSPFGYVVGGVTGPYRFDLYRPEGVLRIEREHTPVPVLPAEREEQERRITENFQSQFPGWKWNGPPIPDTKSAYRGLSVDEEGRIWVLVSARAEEYRTAQEAREEERLSGRPAMRFREPPMFDLFDHDGRYLGPVVPPPDFRTTPPHIARGDYVWAVTRDELDVARVVRFRLVR